MIVISLSQEPCLLSHIWIYNKFVLKWEKKSGKAWVHSLPEVLSYRIHKRPWSIAIEVCHHSLLFCMLGRTSRYAKIHHILSTNRSVSEFWFLKTCWLKHSWVKMSTFVSFIPLVKFISSMVFEQLKDFFPQMVVHLSSSVNFMVHITWKTKFIVCLSNCIFILF